MNKQAEIYQLADKALQDIMVLQQLSNKVYELMLQDLRIQRDRSRNYRI